MTGQRFGILTVVKRVENRGNHPMWLCRCDCGNEKIARSDSLKGGITRSCGCVKKKLPSTADNLFGMKFNRLTVLKRVGNRGNSAQWLCKCDCGNIRKYTTNELKSEKVKSCGCYKDEMTSKRSLKDLTGQRFGKLTVLHRAPNRTTGSKSSKKKAIWTCKCDCGVIKDIASQELLSGSTKSCGCLSGSYGELFISNLLKEYNIKYDPQYFFKDCKDKGALPFDFYLPDYNLCIEYDGIQHFEPIGYFGGDKGFVLRIKHDQMKNEYCEKNNIGLLRIPYYLSDQEIKDKIINTLNP